MTLISVDGFTAARSQAIEDEAIVSGAVNGDGDLILTKNNSDTINAGSVLGPEGPPGSSGFVICTSSTRPTPSGGLAIYETDTHRAYIYQGGWKWLWSSSQEDWAHLEVNVAANNDATSLSIYPDDLHVSVDVPPWALNIECYALLGQAYQVTAISLTELKIMLGTTQIAYKQVSWDDALVTANNRQDIMLAGQGSIASLAGTTVNLRVTAERLSGGGALRVDDFSYCYIRGQFKG